MVRPPRAVFTGQEGIPYSRGWTDESGTPIDMVELDSYSTESGRNTFSVTNTVPETGEDTYLSFYTYGAYFSVDLDGEEVYLYDYKPIWTAGHSYGTDLHSVRIPKEDAGKPIRINIRLIYGDGASFLDMEIGSSADFVIGYLKAMLPAAIISVITISFGFLIFVIAKSVAAEDKMLRGLQSFAVVSVEIGAWALIETQVLTLIVGHAELFRSFDYLLLMLIPYPMVVSANGWITRGDRHFEITVLSLEIANIVIAFIARVFLGKDLHELYLLIHIMLFYTLIGIVALVIYNLYRKHGKGVVQGRVRLWTGLGFLILCAIMDLVRYSMNDKTNIDGARFTRMGYLVLMYFLVSQFMKDSKAQLRKSIEAQMYKSLAYDDVLTHVGSRVAFQEKEKELDQKLAQKEVSAVAVVSADLNNLKKVNDTYGHGVGDKYILACTKVLREAFEDVGSIYRIGGDEFAIFIENTDSRADVERIYEERLNLLHKKLEEEPPVAGSDIRPSFAIGCDILHAGDGHPVEDAERIADERMYENKKQMKNSARDN